MTSKFNKLYKIIMQESVQRLKQLPPKEKAYQSTDKWKYQRTIAEKYMTELFNDCKNLCLQLFPDYNYYLEAIFQECELVFSCDAAVVDLYGQLLPDGNVNFNLFPILQVTMLNTDKEKIYKILNYEYIFATIPHQLAHIVDITLNGRPMTQEEVHRDSWKDIYQSLMSKYKHK